MNTKIICESFKQYGILVKPCEDLDFEYLSCDSRDVRKGTLFICKGLAFKEEFLKSAIEKGAVAYVSEKEFDGVSIPAIIVTDSRKALSLASIEYFGHPYEGFKTVGITGTKGKTTTSYFIQNILSKAAGRKTAILSTVEMYTGGKSEEAHLTTPESIELQEKFTEVKECGIPYLTMEVSSQAYKVSRVFGMRFNVGLFLNIDEDHIGSIEHPDYEDYLQCKMQLVKNSDTVVIYNKTRDFDRIYKAAADAGAKIYTYGEDNADYTVSDIEKLGEGFKFKAKGPDLDDEFIIDNEGRFNIMNALAAITVARVLGIDVRFLQEGLRNVSVPGRMNLYHKGSNLIIVDYAHNFLSFTALFESLKKDYPGRKIKVVCGAPGHKNFKRRTDIGHLCGKYADYVYLTEEDPGFEDPTEIAKIMASYLEEVSGHPDYEIEVDRVKAVEKAIEDLTEDEILIVAGKGEELYRKYRGEYQPCESDVQVVERMI